MPMHWKNTLNILRNRDANCKEINIKNAFIVGILSWKENTKENKNNKKINENCKG